MNGVQKLKRALWLRKYRVTREVWDAGRKAQGNSLRKALASYRWDKKKEQPIKDGQEDPLDALRYDLICWRWDDDKAQERRSKSWEPQIKAVSKPWEGGSF